VSTGSIPTARCRPDLAGVSEWELVLMAQAGVLTSDLLWRCALFAALIDAPLLALIARRVTTGLFHQLKWYLAGAAFIVYAALWGSLGSVLFWDEVYQRIFPMYFRWLLGPGMGLLFALLALAFWRVSKLLREWQVVCFILFGGLVSLAGHSIGISRGLMRVPLLSAASPASALVFGVFEFIFYWCLIVGIGAGVRWLLLRMRGKDAQKPG